MKLSATAARGVGADGTGLGSTTAAASTANAEAIDRRLFFSTGASTTSGGGTASIAAIGAAVAEDFFLPGLRRTNSGPKIL